MKKKTIRLGFAGDLMLGGEAIRYGRERGWGATYPFKALRPTLDELDVLFVNLEGPLFEDRKAAMRKPLLLANDRAVVEVLRLPRCCVCSLANNHSLDHGADALLKTRRHLDKHGIRHLGAGHTAREAGRELIIEQSGWRIGCLAFTEGRPALDPVIAGPRRPGCAALPDKATLVDRVRRLRGQVDLLVLLLHWGRDFHEYPSPAQVRLARALVDAGADLIAGHHPHAIQAMEEYRGSIIAYSLGHLYMPPFRERGPSARSRRRRPSENDGPVFYPRPASKEFLLMRVEVPGTFPASPGSVDVMAGGMDGRFRLRPYNRIGLQSLRSRLDDLACPLRNGSYAKFWKHYRLWRPRELDALREIPAGGAAHPARRTL